MVIRKGESMKIDNRNTCLIIVTYKRFNLLCKLLESIKEMTTIPAGVVIVDNESSQQTSTLVEDFKNSISLISNNTHVFYIQQENLGGSGGFCTGFKLAYELGYDWLWAMDDDVSILPDALDVFNLYQDKYSVLLGNKLSTTGEILQWQYCFNTKFGLPDQIKFPHFTDGIQKMNNISFEGTLFSRKIVDEIGFPDSRFFINWDDTAYGLLASKYTTPVLLEKPTLKKTISNSGIGFQQRKLSTGNDLKRFYIIRNRAILAKYLRILDYYNPVLFAIGTFFQFCKEILRLVIVEKSFHKANLSALHKGIVEYSRILRDNSWHPESYELKDLS